MKNEAYRYLDGKLNIRNRLIVLFTAPFVVWQMGIMYFSGTTLSLLGSTPIPLLEEDTALLIALGYIISMIAICTIPRKIAWIQRILLPIALAATILMLFPFSPGVITVLFYISAFVCVFSIGGMASFAAQQFALETAWRDGILGMIIAGCVIAFLKNDLVKINFTIFTIVSALLIAALIVFFYTVPAKITVPYVSRANKISMPKPLFFGIWLLIAFSTLLVCFATSFAESIANGVSVIYLSAAVFAVLLYFLRKKLGNRSAKAYGAFFMLTAFGFLIALISLQYPQWRLLACILMGFTIVVANLWLFFSAKAFQIYPTRFIGAIGTGIGFGLMMLHAGLLEGLRDNLPLLYGIYAACAGFLMLVYYFLEPYFLHPHNADNISAVRTQTGGRNAQENNAVPSSHPFAVLSDQERNLAFLILAGHTESSIARIMNITINTQKGYRKNLYSKLGIHSKRELFALMS